MKDFGGAEILYRACLSWVTNGKTPSEYIFSELPQVADIARSAFSLLARPLVLQITAFWVRATSRLSTGPIISIRSSRIDWLWFAKRASVWVTGGSRCWVN